MALEPRMMFDGAGVATAADTMNAAQMMPDRAAFDALLGTDINAALAPKAPAIVEQEAVQPLSQTQRILRAFGREDFALRPGQDRFDRDASDRALGRLAFMRAWADPDILTDVEFGTEAASTPNAVIFIDRSVVDYQLLVNEWQGRGDIVLIDNARDGIDQIMTALAGRTQLDAIHIVSHGDIGSFRLGLTTITQAAVQGELAASFVAIGGKLSANGDILIYGCDVGSGDAGQKLINAIALTTGADVAASIDDTGSILRGGDWTLENRLGSIEGATLVAERWDGLLAPAIISINPTTTTLRVFNAAGAEVSNSSGAGTGFAGGTSIGVSAGGFAVWSNAGTVSGQAVDLRAVLVTSTTSGVSPDVIRFNQPSATSNDPGFLLQTSGSAGTASIQVRWELVLAGTNTPIAADISFTIADIDGTGANSAAGALLNAPTRESVVVKTDTLSSFQSAGVTDIKFDTNTAGEVAAFGTVNETASPPQPISAAKFNWLNTSNWVITYNLVRAGSTAAGFNHDGNNDFNFGTGGVTISIPRLDLDANNSTAAGSAATKTYVENAAAVSITDTDVLVTNPAGTLRTGTVVLTNAQTGDVLSVGTLPAGITAVVDTSVAGRITVNLSGTASAASYQAAFAAILFRNTTERPSTIDRKIDTSFFNGTYNSNLAVSTIKVVEVNDAPTAVNDGPLTTAEDTPILNINVLANDRDGEAVAPTTGDPLTVTSARANNGTVTINADGTLNYTPNANFNGTDTITYVISDGRDGKSTATVAITITAVNDPAVLINDAATIGENSAPLVINVLANDSDVDGALTVTNATAPNGVVAINPDGTITYTPNPGFTGLDTITYQVTDPSGGTGTATVAVTVTPFDVAPVLHLTCDPVTGLPANTRSISWESNSPAGSPNATIQRSDLIASGVPLAFGGGVTVTSPSFATTGRIVAGATATTLAGAISGNDFIQTAFTTAATLPSDAAITQFAQTVLANNAQVQTAYPYSVGILVSTSANFSNYAILLQDRVVSIPAGAGGFTFTTFNTDAPFELDPNTTYFVRTYIYNVTSTSGLAAFDDFAINLTGCDDSFENTFTENGPSVAISSAALSTISDIDDINIESARIVITNRQVGDLLEVSGALPAGITASYDAATGTLTLTGTATEAAYRTAINAIRFNNSSDTPSTVNRNISATISDGEKTSQPSVAVIRVIPVNDTPTPVGILSPQANVDAAVITSVPTAQGFADPDGPPLTYSATGLPAGLTINAATGVISGTINRSASQPSGGIYNVVVTASDGSLSTTQAFTWTVSNPAPIAADDTALIINEDTAGTTVNVLANDRDPDGDPLTIVSASATNGTVVINANGTLTYTPNANYNGPAAITYTISDGQGGTATATIPVTVVAVNDAPTRVGALPPKTNVDAAAGINVPTAVAFADIDGPALTYSAAGLPAGLTINTATGVITGTIDRSASQINGGVYTVIVTASDGANSVTQSFAWTVSNPPPVAANDTVLVINEDTAGTTINVLANDNDPDGDPLTIVSASATNGTVVINANGTLTYTPNPNYNGPATITYTISDGQGGTSTATIPVTVVAVNDAPTGVGAIPPRTNIDGAVVSVPTAASFADVDNATLTYSAAGLPAGLTIDATTGIISGTIDRSASQPNGGSYAVTVTARDAAGLTATQTFNWTVTNPAPIAVNDTATTTEDTPVLIAVLPNDSDPDGDPLTIISAFSAIGQATIVGNQIQYTPPANFNGTATITYTVSDGQGGTATATITVTVTPVNDAPIATPIAPRSTVDGATLSVPVAGNFSDLDGDVLSFGATGLPPGLTIDPVTGVISGVIDKSASQTNGGTYTAIITASDGKGGTVTQTITFNVTNPPPVAANDAATTPEDTPVTIPVLANDTDPDGDPLTVTSASAPNGTVVINPDGTVTYTPNPGFNGTDTITYEISDGNGGTSLATVTVSVADVNDVPVSGVIANQTNLDAQVIGLPVAGAFSDPDGDTLRYAAAGLPAGLTIDPATGVISGTIDNSASQGNGGVYTITVTASDGRGGAASSTFTWTVSNPGPTAENDAVTTNEDTPVRVPVLANDVDPDGDALTVVSASAGNGTVTINADGSLLYTPNANFNGEDTIIYRISDGEGGFATATATITVRPVNDGPTTVGLPNQNGDDGAAVSVSVASAFTDIDGDVLTFSAIGLPPVLSIDPVTGLITGTLSPETSQNGPYVVSITATDSSGNSVTTDFVWSVQNIPPVAVNDVASTTEDTPVTVGVLTNDRDPDGDPLTITAASATNGTVVINPNGTVTFTPNPDFNGTAVVSYTVTDGNGGFATATLTVTVGAANDGPTSVPIPNLANQDNEAASVNVGDFFSDKDGDTLSFGATGLPAGIGIDPATGILTGTLDKSASQPNGGVYSVTITATDPGGLTTSRTFTWTVTNPAPTAANDAATTNEDTPVSIPVLGNDTDPDGDPLTVTAATALNGTVSIGAGGVLLYTPNANFNGEDTITYVISDGNGGTSTAVVRVTVTPVNDAPVAVDDVATTNEDTPVTFGVLGNDSDVDGDPLTVTAATSPNGTVVINPDGTLTFTPAPNFNGPTTVTYAISDGNGGTATATVTITVDAINDGPVAVNDTAATPEDTPVTIPVLANDTDVDGDPLTVTAATSPNGIVVINPDGTVTFTPAPNFNGPTTITYTISDGNGGFSTATVNITVSAVNDLPVATPIAPQNENDSDVINLPVAGNFSDVDGDPLTFTATGLPPGLSISPAGVISGTIDKAASQGGPNGDGIYSVTVTASDGKGGTVSTTFTYTVGNPPPVAGNDTATTNEDTPVTVAVLANDTDPDGDPLTVVSATAPNGTVVIDPDGTVTYTPNPNFNGTDTITYTISDGNGGTSTAIVTVTVAATNDAPTIDAPIPAQSENDGTLVVLPIAGNFTDLDGDPLTFTATGLPLGLTISPAGVISGTIDKSASQGGPNAGGIYTVTVTASDGKGGTVTSTFTYTVGNPPPVATNDNATTNEDTSVIVAVLANDTDPDADPLTVISATAPNGSVVINPDGTITYTPNPNFNGTDTITYSISDGNGGTSTATVTVTVVAVNDLPTVDTPIPNQSLVDNQPFRLPVAGNFTDLDADPLTFTATGLPVGLTINAAGVISGTIDKNASQLGGGIYTVIVTASDGKGGTVSSTFTIGVENPVPTAVNDTATTTEDTATAPISVLANDNDPDGDPLTVTSASAPNGVVVINADGTLVYTPNPDFNGTDTITYTISDGNGGTATATVTVTVTPVNDVPVATPIAAQNDVDAEIISLPIASSFSDVDGDALTFTATGLPTGLMISPDGLISGTIDPAASQFNGGVYTVTVTANDGNGGTVTQTFTWTITNPAPVATDDIATTVEDAPVTIAVLANDTDADGDVLTVTTAAASNGVVVINADGTLLYTPNTNFNGTDTITYTISDGNGGTSTATVTISVTPDNDAPTSNATIPPQTNLDADEISLPVGGNFSDLDGDTLTFMASGLPAGLTIGATGVISGTIDRAASQVTGGVYSVTVTADDGNGGTVSQTFVWTVTNPAPTAANDTATVAEDGSVNIPVLANDADPDGDPITVTAAIAANGTVTVNPDGTITYVPNANFNGTDTISYTISDGNGGTSTAIVTVTVTPVNDAPTTVGLPDLFDSNSEFIATQIAPAFADLDGNTLSFGATGLPTGLSINPLTGAITGQIAANASAGGPNSDGIYTVTITANDGNGGTVATVFTWTISNVPPTAVDDTYITNEDVPITMNVTANDVDPDANPGTPIEIINVAATNGTAVIDPDGRITFTPNPNYNGVATVTYTISDGLGGFSTAVATITINPVNDAPIASAFGDQNSVDSQAISLPLGPVFSDLESDTLTYSAAGLPLGLMINEATGEITGTIDRAASQASGGVYSVTITATDPGGLAADASFVWRVTNPAPNAVDDTATTTEDVPVDIPVLDNDNDPDRDPLTITTADAANGVVAIGAGGVLTYTPNANFNGTDTITYTISDGNGGISTATVVVTINPANDAPVATAIAPQTVLDSEVISLPVAASFKDLDGDALTFTAIDLPAGLSISPDGVISGTIDKAASQTNGGIYLATITADDGNGGVVTQTVTFTVTNPAPTADDEAVTTPEDTLINIPILVGDFDPDGDPLTITAASAPNGAVTIKPDGTIDYVPNANFNGTDTITYTISDGNGGTATAVVTVTVTSINDAPVAQPLSPLTNPDASVITLALAGNFSDVDGDPLTFVASGLPQGLTMDAAGVISGTIDPAASQAGPNNDGVYSVTVTADDGKGGTVSSTFTWTITNPAPVAVNDTATTPEDTLVNILVLANDSDPDDDLLTVTTASAGNGTVVIRPDGTLDYTPNLNFNGTDTISYTISDGNGGTSTATVIVTVGLVNDLPVATPIAAQANLDTDVVSLPVAGNFSDVDGDPLTFTAIGLPSGLTISPAGVISGTVDKAASQPSGGVYSVTVTADDGKGGTVSSTFTWTITNPAPAAVNDAATTPEETLVNIPVLANDSDPDGDLLTVTTASAGNGAVVIRPDGTLDYTPNPDFNGTDTITYTISDGNGGTSTATVTVTVGPINDPPVAVPDAATTNEDTPVIIPILGNDSDVDGDPLTVTAATSPNGTIVINADGTVTYTPKANFNGTDVITYTISDGKGGTATSTVTVIVAPVNDAPVARPDTGSTPEDTPVTLTVLGNDTDADGDPLTVTGATSPDGLVTINPDGTVTFTPNPNFNGATTLTYTISDGKGGTSTAVVTLNVAPVNDPPVATNDAATTNEDTPVRVAVLANDRDADGDPLTVTAATAPNGTVTINPDGTITYTPNANFNGTDTITYTVSDGKGGTTTATVTVTVNAVNDVPVAVNDVATTPEDEPVTIPILGNDSDADGDPLTITAAASPNGTVVINPDGTITFTPAPNFNGPTTITYTISDGKGGTATAKVTVTVTAVNDPPVARPDTGATPEDTPVRLSPLANDTDADGNPLTIVAANAPNGTVVVNPDGTITYTPNRNFNGTDVITYQISDGRGGFSTATITITVAPVNDPPVAVNDVAATDEDMPVRIPVLANDTDADGDRLTVTAASAPNGTVVINADGTVTYTPKLDFFGTDTITYTITDGKGGTSTATVTINVRNTNERPTDGDETAIAIGGSPKVIDVIANARDPEGDKLTIFTAKVDFGTVTINPDGTITYLAAPDFQGIATITYILSDGKGGFVESVAIITVTQATADVNALLGGREPARPDGWLVDEVLDQSDAFISVPLIIVDTANSFRSLNGTPDLNVPLPILTAINGIRDLRGTQSLDVDGQPIDQVIGYMDRIRDLRFGADRMFDPRFGDFFIKSLTGFSVRQLTGGNDQVMIESVVRDRVIYMEVRDIGKSSDSPIIEYQLRMRDGRPLPEWIRMDARGLAIIERPVDADEIRLIVRAIRADGKVIEIPVRVQGATGEIQLDEKAVGKKISDAAPLSKTMALAEAGAAEEAARLAAAFNGKA
jgi:large repetitive protein